VRDSGTLEVGADLQAAILHDLWPMSEQRLSPFPWVKRRTRTNDQIEADLMPGAAYRGAAANQSVQTFRVDGLELMSDLVGGIDGTLRPILEAPLRVT
jgi:hypothetical protein